MVCTAAPLSTQLSGSTAWCVQRLHSAHSCPLHGVYSGSTQHTAVPAWCVERLHSAHSCPLHGVCMVCRAHSCPEPHSAHSCPLHGVYSGSTQHTAVPGQLCAEWGCSTHHARDSCVLLTLTVVVFLVCSLTRSSRFTSCGSPSCSITRSHDSHVTQHTHAARTLSLQKQS